MLLLVWIWFCYLAGFCSNVGGAGESNGGGEGHHSLGERGGGPLGRFKGVP